MHWDLYADPRYLIEGEWEGGGSVEGDVKFWTFAERGITKIEQVQARVGGTNFGHFVRR